MFLLVCAAGMSTSLLVNRMKEAAETKEIEFQIEAHPVGQIEKYGEAADDILLGPQVRYELKNVKTMFLEDSIRCEKFKTHPSAITKATTTKVYLKLMYFPNFFDASSIGIITINSTETNKIITVANIGLIIIYLT